MTARLARRGQPTRQPRGVNKRALAIQPLLLEVTTCLQRAMDAISQLASHLSEKTGGPSSLNAQLGSSCSDDGTPQLPPRSEAVVDSVPPKRSPQKKRIDPRKLSEVRQIILRAIAHYERVAPRSIIDVQAIRMYIEEHHQALIAKYNVNILSSAVHALRTRGLIRVHLGKDNRWRQYRLTVPGKRCIRILDTMTPQSRQKEK